MTGCFRLLCGTTGVIVALGAAGCGSVSRLAKSSAASGSSPGAHTPGEAVGSFVASVNVNQGTITFRSDRARTAGRAHTAAQQYGPGDRLTLSGSASYSSGILSGNVQLVSANGYPLNDARVVVTSISDSSVTVANADGTTTLGSSTPGANQPYWDYVTLDPNTPSSKLWKFNNPGAVNFTFRVTVFANVWSYSVGDANPNTGVSFPDPLHGWMVGVGGKLLATTDGGVTWLPQNAGTDIGAQLNGVYFANQFNGWIVGTGGTIRHTSDGGRTWYPQTTSSVTLSQYNLQAVRFVDSATGWVVGSSGLILKTTDAGNTWTAQASPSGSDVILYSVDFADANNGWAVGQGGTILHTTNGGASWGVQIASDPSSGTIRDPLLSVSVRDAAHAWICGGSGRILFTTNGFSWNLGSSGVSNAPLTGIFFINTTTGWAVGGAGLILKSTDGGMTWTPKTSGGSPGLFFIRFTDINNGWAVGQSGTVLHSTDGGETWTTRSQGVAIVYNGVDFPDRSDGWMVGAVQTSNNTSTGIIRATSDGGQNWAIQSTAASGLNAVRFADKQNGWTVGDNGTILHTGDGGNTWVAQNSGTTLSLLGVDFSDALHGCVVGGGGTILYTGDGGNTWAQVLSPVGASLSGVSMVDADLIYVVGNTGTILVTANGSQGAASNWSQEFQPFPDDLNAIKMVDANNGWAVGGNGRILHTIDGGTTWDSQNQEPSSSGHTTSLYGVDFEAIPLPTPSGSPQQYKYVGWAVGDGGRMLRTTNGGATWTKINVGTLNSLHAFRFTDPDSGWAVGTAGTIEHLN